MGRDAPETLQFARESASIVAVWLERQNQRASQQESGRACERLVLTWL